MRTIRELLDVGRDDAIAIVSEGGGSLTFRQLRQQVASLASQLAGAGVEAGDRVAIVLPNGPTMAETFLSVASCATAAPLNPAYTEDEFRFYLDDLGAKALIMLVDGPEAARRAASGLVPLVLTVDASGDGRTLSLASEGHPLPCVAPPEWACERDESLVLHTSGTTSRPKVVPLTQANLVRSACNIAMTLALEPSDRCLEVMPLFHIHGLMAGLLSSLSVGASVACPPAFDPFRFFGWIDEFAPTWYTAVPTMHQLVLARADRHAETIARRPFRFVRSSSAALAPQVMARLEETFDAPVIEAYGMTEASHQMASNPLPPAVRKPGSVGKPTGIELAIADGSGTLLGPHALGEVVIRGASVTLGYAANPEANASAFFDGWFRTGDQGYLDDDGYLFLTGRLKEIINRGGEKVSPREVDEVLLTHPSVAQAVTFAVADERLGESVAAAVVLREGTTASAKDLRAFAAERLAAFKVPRSVVLLEDIPRGPTGKIQRIGLAQRLGLQ